MAAVTVRNLPDETLRALKLRAAKGGRSTESEIREILADAVRSPVGLGSALASIGRKLGGVKLDPPRKRSVVKPAHFE
jgi:antitoxin FitA